MIIIWHIPVSDGLERAIIILKQFMNINPLYCKTLIAQFGDFLPVELLETVKGLLLCPWVGNNGTDENPS